MKKFYAIILLLSATVTFAQTELNYFEGEVLVRLDGTPESYNADKLSIDSPEISIVEAKLISRVLNIWHLTFDNSNMDEKKAIETLYLNNNVTVAQKNHRVSSRATTPDDERYSQQWQYFQENDRDIDADDAWDVTTGGLTENGVTIVSAVVDGGFQLSHPDMVDRYWVNEAEIPNNGIDDDENGFVDDVNGWNPFNDTDNVPLDSHGTAVAGIIGAHGNNGIGVTGVNWDAKIMAISGSSGSEAIVVESYDYVLQNRLKFNESGGTEGAFVVVTNASFGVDGGQPANAPLWCDMYDTLGQAGILSCGATANANFNIDETGDLPTACPSEFLIAVTNTNRQDVKVTQAGYGATTIDLGAPGQGTYTITSGSGYSQFGGTSGATPHVAGSIALLYAAPYEEFVTMAMAEPEETARLVRDFIFDGVDPNESLDEGITVTGGRLNVNNSMQLLRAQFDPLFVDDFELNNSFSLSPNPVESVLNLQFDNGIDWTKATVYSLQGAVVKTFENNKVNAIDVASLSVGSYILNVQIEGRDAEVNKLFIKK